MPLHLLETIIHHNKVMEGGNNIINQCIRKKQIIKQNINMIIKDTIGLKANIHTQNNYNNTKASILYIILIYLVDYK